jgi:tetratricopeptide (TPR) repeat protein
MHTSQPRRSRRTFETVRRTLLLVGVAAMGGTACSGAAAPPRAQTQLAVPVVDDAAVRDSDIAFYTERVKNDPTGAADLARLASLYFQRSRETGDWRDAERAESMSRQSLRNRATHNDAASQVLASSLLAQHKFDEALRIARALRDGNPTSAPLRAAVAEIHMELGMYDSARVAFDSLAGERDNLAVVPRLARWAEIDGRQDDARRLMRHGLAVAKRHPRIAREQLAWFHLRVGDIEMRSGRFRAADSAYRAGLAARDGDHRLLAASSHLAAVEGRWQDAIRYGDSAIAQTLDPATLGTLSDVHRALGDTARAREYAHALDVAVRAQPGAYHRAWSLFLLDHGKQSGTLHRKIREELATRHDVYGYDLYAWSLFKQGRRAEARKAMALALREGTRDAQLFYHAAMIEQAAGNDSTSREHLAQARALNPSLK